MGWVGSGWVGLGPVCLCKMRGMVGLLRFAIMYRAYTLILCKGLSGKLKLRHAM